MKRILHYILLKFAGAGFTMGMLALFVLFSTGFDLFELQNSASALYIWLIIYVYGILVSCLIDWMMIRAKHKSISKRVSLYIASGYLFFILFLGVMAFVDDVDFADAIFLVAYAGTIGAGCALLYYVGTLLAKRNKVAKIVFSLVIPLLFIVLLQSDVTVKKGWNEHREANLYQAEFKEFNGEHRIPIKLEQGEELTFSVDWQIVEGGYGSHVKDSNGDLQGMKSVNENQFKLQSEKTQTYYITLVGHQAQGSIIVEWKIKK